MKISKSRLKEIVRETITEDNEYQDFFKKSLEKAGKSIPSMSDEEKKSFFDKIDAAWNGKGEKRESVIEGELPPALKKAIEDKKKKEGKSEKLTGDQDELDADGDGDIEADDLADLRKGKKVDEADGDKQTFPNADPNYFPNKFNNKFSYYVLIGTKVNVLVAHDRKSSGTWATTYNIYTKSSNKFIGSANSIKGGERTMKKIPVNKAQLTSSKSFKDLLKNVGSKQESVNEARVTNNFTASRYYEPKIGDEISFIVASNRPGQLKGKVRYDKGLGFIVLNNGKKLEVKKLMNIKVIKLANESVNESTEVTPKQAQSIVNKVKKQLIGKFKRKGAYENFGQTEIRKLQDKLINTSSYTDEMNKIRDIIDSLDNWAGSYNGANESVNESSRRSNDFFEGSKHGKHILNIIKKAGGVKSSKIKKHLDSILDKLGDVKGIRAWEGIANNLGLNNRKYDNVSVDKFETAIIKAIDELYQIHIKTNESVNESFSPDEITKFKDITKKSGKLMGLSKVFDKLGYSTEFVMLDSIPPHLKIRKKKNDKQAFVIVNKQYADDSKWVVNGLAGGLVNESILKEDAKKVWKKGKTLYVDSDFVNLSKGKLPNSELKHAGMGNFFLQTPGGNVSFSRVSGKFDGMSGRGHQMDGDSKLVAQLIKKMGAKIINESVNEAYTKLKSTIELGQGKKGVYYVHKVGFDTNGNWSYIVSRGGNKPKKIQHQGNWSSKITKTSTEDDVKNSKTAKEIIDYFEKYTKESVNEAGNPYIDQIYELTHISKQAITKYVKTYKLDGMDLMQYLGRGGKNAQKDFATAVSGKDGNRYAKQIASDVKSGKQWRAK